MIPMVLLAVAEPEVLPHSVQFLQDLALVMIVAGAVTVLFHRLKQPVVLGYILAGVIIGPYTPYIPLQVDEASVATMAELGIIFLMLSLGLHFSLKKLAKVGGTAFVAATLEIVLMIWIGFEIGRVFGWSNWDSLFLGAILSISSTTIIIKALSDLKLTHKPFAELVFGILIVEDILAIVIIALLSSLATTGALHLDTIGITFGKLIVFLAMLLVLGLLLVPRLLDYVDCFHSPEMMLVTVLGLTFGVSYLAVHLNYSVALGAFLIGAIIAESRHQHRIESLIGPVRDMFSAVFFVAIGMLINPTLLRDYTLPIAVITVAVVLGKVATCTLGAFVAGNPPRISLRVGMSLAQIGEFSFIIAALGLALGKTSDFLYPIVVTVSVLTTLLTPYLIRSADRVADGIPRWLPQRLTQPLQLYHIWISTRHRDESVRSQVRGLMRKWVAQMGLNVALMTGLFAVAVYFAGSDMDAATGLAQPRLPAAVLSMIPANRADALLWLAAMLVALPLLIATLRKLRAAAMLMAEVSVSKTQAREQTGTIRAIVTNTIMATGATVLGLWLLLLSSTLLPTGWVLVACLVVLALVTILAWRWLVKIYARGQIALRETLAREAEEVDQTPPRQLPSLLERADLETVTLAAASPAAGQHIRELNLRSISGASIVAIERQGQQIINPPADEILLAGDHVLLLGLPEQIVAARGVLMTVGTDQKKEQG
ncbi:MAG: cation:proton antiporter [Phycisphaeraceae bacterium]